MHTAFVVLPSPFVDQNDIFSQHGRGAGLLILLAVGKTTRGL